MDGINLFCKITYKFVKKSCFFFNSSLKLQTHSGREMGRILNTYLCLQYLLVYCSQFWFLIPMYMNFLQKFLYLVVGRFYNNIMPLYFFFFFKETKIWRFFSSNKNSFLHSERSQSDRSHINFVYFLFILFILLSLCFPSQTGEKLSKTSPVGHGNCVPSKIFRVG